MGVEPEHWEVLTPEGQINELLPVLPWSKADEVKALAIKKFGRSALAVRVFGEIQWSLIKHPRIPSKEVPPQPDRPRFIHDGTKVYSVGVHDRYEVCTARSESWAATIASLLQKGNAQ
jgi:hypothetical protein